MLLNESGFLARANAALGHRYFLPLITLASILFRLCLQIALRHSSGFADELDYQAIGISLWKHSTYAVATGVTAYRPPAEPMMIALFYAVLGQHPFAVKVAENLLLGALPLLCAMLGRSLGLSTQATNVGALLAAFHPGLAYAATTFYPTVLTTVALCAHYRGRRRLWRSAVAQALHSLDSRQLLLFLWPFLWGSTASGSGALALGSSS